MKTIHNYILLFKSSTLLKGSVFGLIGAVAQSVFNTIFFLIIASIYVEEDQFGKYVIAMSLVQIAAALSSMGLSNWYIREVAKDENDTDKLSQFIQIQFVFACIFVLLGVIVTHNWYNDELIIKLSYILAINVFFENYVYALRSHNIVFNRQGVTSIVLFIDGLLKLLLASVLLVIPIDLLTFAVLTIVARLALMFLAFKSSFARNFSFNKLYKPKDFFTDTLDVVKKNWTFAIIGATYIIFWRFTVLIISKLLSNQDVAVFEIAFKGFSLFALIPMALVATLYPDLVRLHTEGNTNKFSRFYYQYSSYLFLYGVVVYAIVYFFASDFVEYIFQGKYVEISTFISKFLLVILIYPVTLFQASVLVAIGKERQDMYLNILNLIVQISACIIALSFQKNLDMVVYSCLISNIIFLIGQDAILVKHEVISYFKSIKLKLVILAAIVTFSFIAFSNHENTYLVILGFGIIVPISVLLCYSKKAL